MTDFRKLALSTGVTLNVALAGDPGNPPVILLHGFPESHRTWREIAPRLQDNFFLVMPDQRGFAGSDRPQEVEAYATDTLIDDIFALADALGLERFALVGHDWGGAISWAAALRTDPRLTRLAIVNAPHPVIFQKSLIEDREQRAASQYIIDWSQPGAMTAMLNWYRASKLMVPPPGVTLPLPQWLLGAFPKVQIPTLVIWGMKDKALLPTQLDGLDALVEDLTVVRLPNVGHFAPWEAGDAVSRALEPFLEA